jgi:2-octaprenyl-6-methoxyphenol hydroxylase
MTLKHLEVDVLIAGGGLVGGTLAVGLVEGGLSVAVVDMLDPLAVIDVGFDGRAAAIALSSKKLLDGLSLWETMQPEPSPIKEIRVSDADSVFFLHYDRKDVGAEAFGYMVENRSFRESLRSRFKDLKDFTLLAPNTITSIERGPGEVWATLANGYKVKAKLIVGAEGRNSPTRDAAGIKLTSWSYKQRGIVCTVAHELSHDNVAHEHFLPAGPFAILPLPNNHSSIVWTERVDLVDEIMALDDVGFLTELKKRFGDFLGKLKVVGPRWAYPLSLQFAERAVDHRLVLAGDASHGMHPIAGQGLNMGLRDVAVLAEVLTDARRLGLDPGSGTVLNSYEQKRRFDNTLMLAMTDLLNRLFSNDIEPVRLVRDLGLATVNKLPPLKRVLIEHAMGHVGDLPRLMRGEPL